METEHIARVCHEANRAYCLTLGDTSQVAWDDAPEWQKNSAVEGVRFRLANPSARPSDMHRNWVMQKVKDGWKHGPVKDANKKEHPCMVEYHELPIEQQRKDALFSQVVRALTGSEESAD